MHPPSADPSWSRAEQATLAAAVRDPSFRAHVLDAGEDVFRTNPSRAALRILRALVQSGQRIDPASFELALGVPLTVDPSTEYWDMLLDARLHHQLVGLGRWLAKDRPGVSPRAIAARALQSLNQAVAATQNGAVVSVAAASQSGLQQLAGGDPGWLRLGIPRWDDTAAAWGPDDLVFIAARPSQGKTALGLQLAWHSAQAGVGVTFCSAEMSPEAIGLRAISQVLQWPKPYLKQHLQDAPVVEAITSLAQWPLRIADANGATVPDLQALVARADQQGPRSDVVVIDYLQILRAATAHPNREREVAAMVASLKAWARRDHRLVVVLSQMSRAVEQRADRIPTLADLRESGSQEQDADVVVLIHHPSPDVQDTACQLIVAKNRNGPTGRVIVTWHAESTTFSP